MCYKDKYIVCNDDLVCSEAEMECSSATLDGHPLALIQSALYFLHHLYLLQAWQGKHSWCDVYIAATGAIKLIVTSYKLQICD